MRTHRFLTGLASALLVAAVTVTPARADTVAVSVIQDFGVPGGMRLTNDGGGQFTLTFLGTGEVQLINDTLVSLSAGDGPTADFRPSITFTLTRVGTTYEYAVNAGVTPLPLYNKTLTSNVTSGQQVSMQFSLANAEVGDPNSTPGSGGNPDTLALFGTIASVSPNTLLDVNNIDGSGTTTYDFRNMPGGEFSLTMTGAFPGTSAFTSMFNFIDTSSAGDSVLSSGGFSQTAVVPEPSSLAIVGVSLAGLLAYRRRGKRAPTA